MKVVHDIDNFNKAMSIIANNLSYLQAKPIIEALDRAIEDFTDEEVYELISLKIKKNAGKIENG